MVIRRSVRGVCACRGTLSRPWVTDRAKALRALRGHWGLGGLGFASAKDPAPLSRTALSPCSVPSRSWERLLLGAEGRQ